MKLNKLSGIQGAFISVQKTVNSLSNIRSGDTENIDFVKEKICRAVKAEDFDSDDLQRLFLLLFLNSNTGLYQQFKNSEKCSHIVGYIPMISSHVLAKLIVALKLERILCSSIFFTEGKICHELISISEICVKILDEFEAINFVENIVKTLYKKLALSEDSHVKCSYYVWLKHYDEPGEERLKVIRKWKNNKMNHFLGLITYSLLSLLRKFLKFYFKNDYKISKIPSVFELFQSTSNLNKTVSVNKDILLECSNQLISKCSTNMAAVTCEAYMYWVEIDLDDVPDTQNTLQRKISEEAYRCITVLREAEKTGIFSIQITDLINFLSNISSKPVIIEEPEVDVLTIIANINKSDNPTEWLKKLFSKSFEFTDNIVKILNDNLTFFDTGCRRELFKKGVQFADESTNCQESIKELVLKAVDQESLDNQVKFLEDFVQEYGLKKILMLNDFETLNIKTFNKVVNNEQILKEMYPTFINLAMQDGETVIKSAVNQGITTEIQGKLMANVLDLLSCVCHSSVSTDSNYLLVDSLINLFQGIEKLPDIYKMNYPLFVRELVERNLIDGSFLITSVILPLLDKSQNTVGVSHYSVGLDLIKILVELGTKINNSVVLATLVDVLHENRCQIKYNSDMTLVCEKAITLIELLVEDCIQNKNNFTVDESDCLKIKMKNHKQMNAGYLTRLFPEDSMSYDDLADRLFYMMHRGTDGWSILDLDIDSKRNISLLFSSIWASLTKKEWEMMFRVFSPDIAHFSELFLIISEGFLLLTTFYDSFECKHLGQNNLAYCIHVLSAVINELIARNQWGETNQENTANVFLRFCSMIQELDLTKQEECSAASMKALIALLKVTCKKKPIEDKTVHLITAGIFSLKFSPVRKAVTKAFVEVMGRE